MQSLFQYFADRFYTALSKRNGDETNERIFEMVVNEFEAEHGFKSPYKNYDSFRVVMKRNRIVSNTKRNNVSL